VNEEKIDSRLIEFFFTVGNRDSEDLGYRKV